MHEGSVSDEQSIYQWRSRFYVNKFLDFILQAHDGCASCPEALLEETSY